MKIKRTNKLKRNTSGYGQIEMLLLVVAVVVIGGVGFFVYQNQNKKTASKSTAHAGTPSKLGISNGITVSACKTYSSVYGGIYTVKVLFTKAASTRAQQYDVVDVNGKTLTQSQRTTSNVYYAGTVAAVTINMSVVNKDLVVINSPIIYAIEPENNSLNGNYKSIRINNITNC